MIVKTEICPQCGAEMPINTGYITWCDKCGWNMDPDKEIKPKKLLNKIYDYIGIKLTDNLFKKILKSQVYNSPLSVSKVLAYMIATIVHSIGFLLLYLVFRYIWYINVLHIIFFAIGIVCLPKIPRLKQTPISHESFPELFSLTKQITDCLGSKGVDEIYFTNEFNASFSKAFIKGKFGLKRIISIGLPLFYILDPQERVAVLSHEVAHNINGDITRGFYVGTALNTLYTWYDFMTPRDSFDLGLSLLSKILLFIPRSIVLFLLTTLTFLVWVDHNLAEYYADKLALNISGTQSSISTLKKLHFSSLFSATLIKINSYNYTGNFFMEFKKRISSMPEREISRLERLNKDELSRISTSHPPTMYRIKHLQSMEDKNPKIYFSSDMSDILDKELQSEYDSINKQIINFSKQF